MRSDLSGALAQVRSRLADERDRALAGEIATGTLRWQGAFDHIIATFAKRPITKLDPEVLDILRLTAFQLVHLDRIPASAAVNDAVALTGKVGKRSAVRSGQRGSPTNQPRARPSAAAATSQPAGRESRGDFATLAYLETTLSHPRWLVERWLDRYGFDAAERWAIFDNAPRRADAAYQHAARLASGTRRPTSMPPGSRPRQPDSRRTVSSSKTATHCQRRWQREGLFFIQDEASQLVAELVGAIGW